MTQDYNAFKVIVLCLVIAALGFFVLSNSNDGFLSALIIGSKKTVPQVVDLATRNQQMYALAQTNPQEFYNQAKRANISNTVSASNLTLVEKPVSLSGTLRIMHADDFINKTEMHHYQISTDGGETWMRVEPINELPDFVTEEMTVDVSGYQINDIIAGPIYPHGKINLSFTTHLPPAHPISNKPLEVAVVLIRYQDSGSEIFTSDEAQDIIFTNSQWTKFYAEQSYGKASFTGDTYGWYTLPENMPEVCPQFEPPDHVITDNAINLEGYDFVFMLLDCRNQGTGTGISWGGIGDLGLSSSLGLPGGMGLINPAALGQWYPDNSLNWTLLDRIFAHELGHALGDYYSRWAVYHSHGYDCGGNLPSIPLVSTTACDISEYGDLYDEMGVGTLGHHFGAYLKSYLGWITDSNIITIAKSGTYSLQPIEEIGATVARIQLGTTYPYYLEYRKPMGFDENVREGLYVHYVDFFGDPTGTPEHSTFLLDLHPNDTEWGDNAENASLSSSESYKDTFNDVTIKLKKILLSSLDTLESNSTFGNKSIISTSSKPLTFDVTFGANYTCNQKPIIEFSDPKILYLDATHFTIPFKILNKDSYRCTYSSSENMSYTIDYPANFPLEQSYNQNPFVLSGSESDWLLFDVTVPMNLTKGIYPFTLTVKNNNDPSLTASATVYWGVDSNSQIQYDQN